MATKYYINQNTGQYLGGFDVCDECDPPANSVEVETPPDFAMQVWDGSHWQPPIEVHPEPIGLITDIAYDIVQSDGPWQMVQFFYALQMQGTAQNIEIDYLRKALWAKIKASNPDWLTSDYITKVETWAANRRMPFV